MDPPTIWIALAREVDVLRPARLLVRYELVASDVEGVPGAGADK